MGEVFSNAGAVRSNAVCSESGTRKVFVFFVFLFIRSSWNATWVRIPRPNIAARANFIITGPWAKFKIG